MHDSSRRRWHRVAGLGRDALANVLKMGRAAGFQDRDHRLPAWRRSRIEERHFQSRGRVRIRPARCRSGRTSPFDQAARRHTSFASLFVYPEIDENIEVEINDKDLRVDTYRATGAGGQHINTTDSAVRITHAPTGIVVQCQNQRSQHQNRAVAMQVLRSRLYELELEKRKAETAELEANKADISFGSQIRSYVLAPYQLVKDTRTKLERGDVDSVLNGDIDDFIKEYLLSRRAA